MPHDEAWWNPYRLIPVREQVERKPPLTNERINGISGMIDCSLKNLTPLFIGGNRNIKEAFLTREGRFVVPGSSLKGMLRSLAEIVGGGCMVTDAKGRHVKKKDAKEWQVEKESTSEKDRIHEESLKFLACNKADELCVACRMYGMMERGRGAKVHGGSVCVGDAFLREDKPTTKLFQVLLSSCGTRHEPFYRSPKTETLDGKSRKLYFHQPKRIDSVPIIPENLRSRAWNIAAPTPGHHFDFTVQFSNLRDEEFALLVYSLALENDVIAVIGDEKLQLNGPMRHKIGNAKPLGMGSCRIRIERMTIFQNPAERYASLKKPRDEIYEGERLATEIGAVTKIYSNDTSETMVQLRKMMVWDETDPRDFRYPDFFWFKNPENSEKQLKKL